MDVDVPLTESGVFDNSSSADITRIEWSVGVKDVKKVCLNESSKGGVSIITFKNEKKVVIKASPEPARELFLTRIGRHLGVPAPSVKVLACGEEEYRQALRVGRVEYKPCILLMEFVSGQALCNLDPALSKKFFTSKTKQCNLVLRSLGRILALDVFLNNWDRVPLCHDNNGNFGNIILQTIGSGNDEDGFLVAIDNSMTGIRAEFGPGRRNPQYDKYLDKLRNLLKDLLDYGPEKELPSIANVREMFKFQTPINLSVYEGKIIQRGIAEMFVRLAEFDKFEEEKDFVSKSIQLYDPWWKADLERIDISFIRDMQDIVKEKKEDLKIMYV